MPWQPRQLVALWVLASACFDPTPARENSAPDAFNPPIDASAEIDTAASTDAAPDATPDAATERTRVGLIGLWEFSETGGTEIADTSGVLPAVPLSVVSGSVMFSGGAMMPNGQAVITSNARPRLNEEVIIARAVSLEAWVKSSFAQQGSTDAPVVIAGLTGNINARNISLLQDGARWLARVRTSTDFSGKPDLVSTEGVDVDAMTHLVVVADATQRLFYVNGALSAIDAMPAPPSTWIVEYSMKLGNEASANRQWAGTFALVAMYARALSADDVLKHFAAGPDAK